MVFFLALSSDVKAQMGLTVINETRCELLVTFIDGRTNCVPCPPSAQHFLAPGQGIDVAPQCGGNWIAVSYVVNGGSSFGIAFNPALNCGNDVNGVCTGPIDHNWFTNAGNYELLLQ